MTEGGGRGMAVETWGGGMAFVAGGGRMAVVVAPVVVAAAEVTAAMQLPPVGMLRCVPR